MDLMRRLSRKSEERVLLEWVEPREYARSARSPIRVIRQNPRAALVGMALVALPWVALWLFGRSEFPSLFVVAGILLFAATLVLVDLFFKWIGSRRIKLTAEGVEVRSWFSGEAYDDYRWTYSDITLSLESQTAGECAFDVLHLKHRDGAEFSIALEPTLTPEHFVAVFEREVAASA